LAVSNGKNYSWKIDPAKGKGSKFKGSMKLRSQPISNGATTPPSEEAGQASPSWLGNAEMAVTAELTRKGKATLLELKVPSTGSIVFLRRTDTAVSH
jgi:hypothetical protein